MKTFIPNSTLQLLAVVLTLVIATALALVIAFPAMQALAAAATQPTTAVAGQDVIPLEVVNKVQTFYNDAWTMLAIALGIIIAAFGLFVGVPGYIQLRTIAKIRKELDETRGAFDKGFDGMSKALTIIVRATVKGLKKPNIPVTLQWLALIRLHLAAYHLEMNRPENFALVLTEIADEVKEEVKDGVKYLRQFSPSVTPQVRELVGKIKDMMGEKSISNQYAPHMAVLEQIGSSEAGKSDETVSDG